MPFTHLLAHTHLVVAAYVTEPMSAKSSSENTLSVTAMSDVFVIFFTFDGISSNEGVFLKQADAFEFAREIARTYSKSSGGARFPGGVVSVQRWVPSKTDFFDTLLMCFCDDE